MNIRSISMNKWATFVAVLFIIISPIENVLKIESITYSVGIVLLFLPLIPRRTILTKTSLLVFFLWVDICISAIWSVNEAATGGLLVISVTFIFLILQLNYCYSFDDLGRIKTAFIIQGIVLLLMCYFFGYYMHGRFWIKSGTSSADPNYLSGWFMLPIVCCIERIFRDNKLWIKVLLFVEVLFCFYYIFRTGSRSGLITNTLLVVFAIVYEFRYSIKRHPSKSIVLIIAMVGLLLFGYNHLPEVTLSRLQNTTSLGSRGYIWLQLWNHVKANPLGLIFGYGHASVQMYNVEQLVAHNTFIDIIFNYGIFGFGLFITFLVKNIKNKTKVNPFASIAAISMCILLFSLTALTTRFFMLLLFYIGMDLDHCKEMEDNMDL